MNSTQLGARQGRRRAGGRGHLPRASPSREGAVNLTNVPTGMAVFRATNPATGEECHQIFYLLAIGTALTAQTLPDPESPGLMDLWAPTFMLL